MEKRVLFLQPQRIAGYRMDRGGLVLDHDWPITDGELPASLSAYLVENRDAEFNLLLDLPEEECQLEVLKNTGILDRGYLIKKLTSKRFENSLLSKSSVSGRRNNVSLLLSGVDSNTDCEDILQMLAAREISLRSIHSPITLTAALTRLVSSSTGAQLIVVPLRGCYRLIACMDSVVLFSRRIAASIDMHNAESGNPDYSTLNKSLEETIAYLQRQRSEDWSPTIVLLGMTGGSDAIKTLRSNSMMSSQVKEIRDYPLAVQEMGATGSGAETLLVTAALRCGNGYALKQHRGIYANRKARNICAALAVCGVGAAISTMAMANKFNGEHIAIADSYSQSTSVIRKEVTDLAAAYEQPVEAVRQALVTGRLVELGSATKPIVFLQSLAADVRKVADVSITSVRWTVDEVVNEETLGKLIAQPELPEKIRMEQIYRATLAGVITGEPESALAQFESFVSVLRSAGSDPSVVIVETPFESGSQKLHTATNSPVEHEGRFVLELSNESVAQ